MAVLDAALGDEMVGQTADHLGGAPHYDDFQAVALVKVDVSAGTDLADMFVLQVSELMLNVHGVMVIDQGDGANDGALGVFPLALHQVVADQIADGF